jgi:ABC-type sugar transport system permease subunit
VRSPSDVALAPRPTPHRPTLTPEARPRLHWRDTALFIGPSLLALALVAVVPTAWAIFSSLLRLALPSAGSAGVRGPRQLPAARRRSALPQRGLDHDHLHHRQRQRDDGAGHLLALLTRAPFPGKGMVRALLTVPMIMTPVVSTLVWKTFFFEADLGLINWVLGLAGIRDRPGSPARPRR